MEATSHKLIRSLPTCVVPAGLCVGFFGLNLQQSVNWQLANSTAGFLCRQAGYRPHLHNSTVHSLIQGELMQRLK